MTTSTRLPPADLAGAIDAAFHRFVISHCFKRPRLAKTITLEYKIRCGPRPSIAERQRVAAELQAELEGSFSGR